MPKSKRERTITLTRTKRKGLASKEQLVQKIREAFEGYRFVYVFSAQNQRNAKLKEVRLQWNDSRFFMGRNKVMQVALGRSADDEISAGLHQLSQHLVGQCGLLFTNTERDAVEQFFSTYSELDYARSGFSSPQTVQWSAGPLPQFSHSQEPYLRKLGVPTSLRAGVVMLDRDFTVCSAGDTLTPEQARILRLADIPLSAFKLRLRSVYDKETHEFAVLSTTDLVPLDAVGTIAGAAAAAAVDANANDDDEDDDDDDDDDEGDMAE